MAANISLWSLCRGCTRYTSDLESSWSQAIMSVRLVVKKTAGGAPFSLQIDPERTISELKVEVSKQADMPAEEQRLIYKGQARAAANVAYTSMHASHPFATLTFGGNGCRF